DLHRENILVAERGLVLVDLQAARPARGARARWRDLGRLDHSLRELLSIGDRVRLRAAVLGVQRPVDAPSRAALRAERRGSGAREAGRARRSRRPGRRAERFAAAGGRGLVSRAIDARRVRTLLEEPASVPDLELRRYAARGSDLLCGSAARRAWHAAHALEASGIACATPVALLGGSRLGAPRGPPLAAAGGRGR